MIVIILNENTVIHADNRFSDQNGISLRGVIGRDWSGDLFLPTERLSDATDYVYGQLDLPSGRSEELKWSISRIANEKSANLYLCLASLDADMHLQDLPYIAGSIFSKMNDGLIVTDPVGNITYLNQGAEKIFGWAKHEITGENVKLLMPSDIASHHHKWISNYGVGEDLGLMGRGRNLIAVRKDSTTVPISISVIPVSKTSLDGFIAFIEDRTEEQSLLQKLEMMAYSCPKTGLPNYDFLKKEFESGLSNFLTEGHSLFLVKVLISNFDQITRLYDDEIVTLLLLEFSGRIKGLLEENVKLLARTRDNAFTLLLTDEGVEQVKSTCNALIADSDLPLSISGANAYFNLHIALTEIDTVWPDLDRMSRDLHNLVTRFSKSDRVVYLDDNVEIAIRKADTIEDKLNAASPSFDEFQVYFQPKCRSSDLKIVGAEALVRWFEKDLGFVSPGEFIPVAEEHGLIGSLDTWVLKTVLDSYKSERNQLCEIDRISLNLSPVQMFDHAFLPNVILAFEDAGVSPENFEFEVTESSTLFDLQRSVTILKALKEFGFKIAIDDFGTGYSSLSNLKELPIDVLKVDQSFVRKMMNSAEDLSIVRTIVQVAQTLNLELVAEGVETIEQQDILVDLGCDLLQGYLYSKPIPFNEFLNKVSSR